MSNFNRRTAALIALVLGFLAIVAVLELKSRVEKTENKTSEIAEAFLGLERAIGYGGLIHHFKNAILRPDEPEYIDLAEQAYVDATDNLERVQDVVDQAGINIDTSEVRNAINEYGNGLATVRAARQRGAGISEIDGLVRVNDEIAHQMLIRLQKEVQGRLKAFERTAAYFLSLGLAASLLLIFSVIFTFFYLGWLKERDMQLTHDRQRKKIEREKAHVKELERLLAQIKTANKEQAEFTYAMSHDLKSPSNTIGMLIDELSEIEDLTPDGQSVVADMIDTNMRMQKLVDDVLEYSQIVDRPMVLERVDLIELINEVKADLAADICRTKASVSMGALPPLIGNRMHLRMLFQNLISNAIKFCPTDRCPEIEVTSLTSDEGLKIVVVDNGIGIPEKFRKRVFGMFQRLNASSAYEGSGLGLTVCQRVMSRHNGKIAIGSGIDGGTAFTMTFPEGLA